MFLMNAQQSLLHPSCIQFEENNKNDLCRINLLNHVWLPRIKWNIGNVDLYIRKKLF